MIKLEVSRNGPKNRYELDFQNGPISWSRFLDDRVYDDPRLFSTWIKSLIQDIQLKGE